MTYKKVYYIIQNTKQALGLLNHYCLLLKHDSITTLQKKGAYCYITSNSKYCLNDYQSLLETGTVIEKENQFHLFIPDDNYDYKYFTYICS